MSSPQRSSEQVESRRKRWESSKPLVALLRSELTFRDFNPDDRGQEAVESHVDRPLEDWGGYVGRSIFLVRPICYKLQTFTRINR